jgi:hypothetical protein
MRPVTDTVGELKLPDGLHDGRNLFLAFLAWWRHVSIGPMMPLYSELGRHKEGDVGVMSRIVDVKNMRRPVLGPGGAAPVTRGAIRSKAAFPFAIGAENSGACTETASTFGAPLGWKSR